MTQCIELIGDTEQETDVILNNSILYKFYYFYIILIPKKCAFQSMYLIAGYMGVINLKAKLKAKMIYPNMVSIFYY